MNQMFRCAKSTIFFILFSLVILCFTATQVFAKDVEPNDVDEILSLVNQHKYSTENFQKKLVNRLNTIDDAEHKIELLIQSCAYSMLIDRFDDVKINSNRLNVLATQVKNQNVLEIAKIYDIVGDVKIQDPASVAHKKLQTLFPLLTSKRAKIHYDIAFAMTAMREDFPILENQLLRNTLNKINGQSSYAFEEFSILWTLSAISKEANDFIDFTLQLLRSAKKHNYPINKRALLYNLYWHLAAINDLHIANRVGDQLLILAKEETNIKNKIQLLLAYLENKARLKEPVSLETLHDIKSLKSDDEYWQSWLELIISLYYATQKDEKNSLYYLAIAKDYFNSQPGLATPGEFIEIESILAFNNKDYYEARTKLEKFWWKKYLTIKKNQQRNIIDIRDALQTVIDEEQKGKLIVEQLLIKSERSSIILATVLFIIFLLVIFQYKMYLKLKHEVQTRIKAEAGLREAKSLAIEAQIDAEQAKLKAEEANQAKSEFLSSMSHELRTPLNAVIGFSQIIKRRTDLPEDVTEDVQRIHRSGDHLLSLINDVLDIAKIEAGKTTLECVNFNLRQMVDDIVQMFSAQIVEKGLYFDCVGAQNLPNFIYGDERKLKQIILNLVSNAYKFTEKGGITLRFEYLDRKLVVQVADTGAGVEQNELNLLFEKFTQTESGRSSYQGTGLGLAISREFSRLMGGDITVTSELAIGSQFQLIIQADKAEQKHAQFIEAQVVKLAHGQPPIKILVVDDIELNQLVLKKLLEPLGFIVEVAFNGKEAVERCESFSPHLIFMDYRMPVMNGEEATRLIKKQYPKIKVVCLTASITLSDESAKMGSGSDKLLIKPFKEAEIFSVLTELLDVSFEYKNDNTIDKLEELKSDVIEHAIETKGLISELTKNILNACKTGNISALRGMSLELKLIDDALAQNMDKLLVNYDFDGVKSLFHTEQTASVLVVDDQEINLIIAKAALSELRVKIETASSGREALVMAKNKKYALIITDCEMPDIDGFELTRQLKSLDNTSIILGYTAGKEEKHQECLRAGMLNVLDKPLLPEDFEIIREALGDKD